MEETLTIKLDNLSDTERETLMGLIKKANNPKIGWKPKSGEKYFFINGEGLTASDIYTDSFSDIFRIRIGNCTRTCDEISGKRECAYINKELQNYADKHNKVEIDWKNEKENKCHIRYNYRDNIISCECNTFMKAANGIYFSSEQIYRDAIKTVGEDRIKKYLFGVE